MIHSENIKGIIFDIKEFGVNDGPGLRTTVFLKGCPLRCSWCHNPEGLERQPEITVRHNGCTGCGLCRRGCTHEDCKPYDRCLHICPLGLISVVGEEITDENLALRIKKSQNIPNPGGVTFSGGEPLMQAPFLLSVMEKIPKIPIAIETSGYAPSEIFEKVVEKCELVYMDIKIADEKMHKKYTGVSNKPILQNLEILKNGGKTAVIRTPLVPGITDTKENLSAIEKLVGNLPHELLPYNTLAKAKYSMLPKYSKNLSK